MIDDLKLRAANSFLAYTRVYSKTPEFHGALQSMFMNTSETDKELRGAVVEIIFQMLNPAYRSEPQHHEMAIEVLRDHSAGWWDMAKQAVERSMLDIGKLLEKQAGLFLGRLDVRYGLRCKHNRKVRFEILAPESWLDNPDGVWDLSLDYDCDRCRSYRH